MSRAAAPEESSSRGAVKGFRGHVLSSQSQAVKAVCNESHTAALVPLLADSPLCSRARTPNDARNNFDSMTGKPGMSILPAGLVRLVA